MESKYIEPLVRRAVQEKFPDSLHSMIEILKRIPMGGLPSTIPGIGENLSDAIRQLIHDNIFTIKGAPMDPISELDVLQKIADVLEQTKKDFLDIVFPLDNRNVHDLFCKLVSYSISLKYGVTLRKCTRLLKTTDMMHPVRLALTNSLRADFCQISHVNLDDLADLPRLSKELAAIFINSLGSFHLQSKGSALSGAHCLEESLLTLISEWVSSDTELMSMVRPQTSGLVCWYLMFASRSSMSSEVIWKLHLAVLQGFQQRASRGKKHAFLSGSDVKSWVENIKFNISTTATDMILQLIQVALNTHALHITKGEMDWCLENLHKTEFYSFLEKTKALEIS